MAITILLADDHAILRQGLRRILEGYPEFTVSAEAATGLEAVEMARVHQPNVAVVDIAMKELNGIEAAAQILRAAPRTRVLMLSMYDDARYVVRAIRAGASGYVLKDSVEDELVQAIHQVQGGGQFFSSGVARHVETGYYQVKRSEQPEDAYERLTKTQRLVYQLLAEGNSNKEIAARLNISVHTVETHRARIMDTLELHSAAELVLSAVRRGLVT